MLIYNKAVFSFITKAEFFLKEILENEAKIQTLRTRFILNKYYYPIHVVVFTGKNQIGYFDQNTYQIGLNENLIYQCRDHVLKDIIRHELAHYLTFISHPQALPHGTEFKETCRKYQWDKAVELTQMDLESYKADKVANLENEKVINKVKKLLSLAQSSNSNEAQLATVKANKLLLKHNLQTISSIDNDEDIFVAELFKVKRRNAKIGAIYDILKHFYVNPVLRYTKEGVVLEACGTKLNIELAQYVASFLDSKLDELWSCMKPKLKGLKAKNSFYHGLAKGYNEKVNQMEQQFTHEEKMSLIQLDQKLKKDVQKIYKRLSSTSSNASIDGAAFNNGKKAGLNLNINKAIKSKTKRIFLIGN